MRIKGRAWRRLATAIAVPGIAVGTLAGAGIAPAMAGTAHHTVYKQETIFGATRSASGIVPIQAYGAFFDRGFVNLNGPDPGRSSLVFRHGIVRVYHRPAGQSMRLNPKSCYAVFKERANYWITGGTGRYWHAKGWGVAHVTFSGVLPRRHGKCDTNANPLPGTSYTTFLAQGPVALR
jgi:hypothetical protein